MYGEELRPDQISIRRTFEAVWMMPLENPNNKEISCKSRRNDIICYPEINHLHEDKRRSMRKESSAKASHSEAKSKGEISRCTR